MSYFKNFNVATCFEDLALVELGKTSGPTSIHSSAKKIGAFADRRFACLRLLAYEAYYLTAQVEFRNGWHFLKAFNRTHFVEKLAMRTAVLVDKIEEGRDRYPSLAHWKGQRTKKGMRLIPEWELLVANLRDNPQVDPMAFSEFIDGFDTPIQSISPFGALALLLYDYAIDFFKNGDIGMALESMYRAQALVNQGTAIIAGTSGENYLKGKARGVAEAGGVARSRKFKALEQETIRLYLAGTWDSVPSAAQEITPQIVAMSKGGNGDLLPSTTKPLEWIRAYNRSIKK